MVQGGLTGMVLGFWCLLFAFDGENGKREEK